MSQGRHIRVGTWALTAVAGLLVTAALVNVQQRRAFRLPDDGATWIDSEAGVRAQRVDPEGPAAKVGVRPGDLLRRINRRPLERALDVERALAAIGVWSRAEYTVEREGATIETALIVRAAPREQMIDVFQWILGAFYLGVGLLVVLRGRERPMARRFFAFCLASFALYAFRYTGELGAFDRLIYWGDVWAMGVAPVLFLHFCLVFPGGKPRAGDALAATAAWGVAGAVIAAQHLAGAGWIGAGTALADLRFLLDRVQLGLLAGYFLLGAGLLRFRAARSDDIVVRRQRQLLAAGALWGTLPFAVLYVGPFVAGEAPTPDSAWSVFSLALIPISFAWAIAKRRLMDVDLFVRRGASYSLATAALLAVFYGAVFRLAAAFEPRFGELGPAGWAVSVLAAALLFHPLRSWIQRTLDRGFYRERYDYRRTLVEFSSELSAETDPERMLAAAADRLVKTLELNRLAIFVREGSGANGAGARFTLVKGVGLSRGDGGAITPETPLDLSFLSSPEASNGRGYLFFENPRWRIEQDGAGREAIAALDLNYYTPCRARGRTIAYLGLGRTRKGDYLTSEDLALVQAVCGNFAIALENARLYRSLERKALEYQRLKEYNENIVESLSAGIMAIDLEGRVESWNTQLELLFGISRQKAIGRRIEELLPARLVAEVERVRGESGVHNIYKLRLRAADFPAEFRPAGAENDERERILDLAVTPLVAKDFSPIGRLLILDDVSERVELEQQLAQADKLSSIGLLAAGVAHEVNTPLAVISSYAQMLARQLEGDEGKAKIIEKITAQSFRASEIVNSLLNFSRTSPSEFAPVDLGRAIRETVSLVEPQMRQAGVRVETEIAPGLPTIRGVTGKLQQVLLNLMLNARDAMPEGGRLRIDAAQVESKDAGTAVRIRVSDNGVGIEPERLGRIFDPFYTTKGSGRGTGLGLAVSYGIIQEHSGRITVDSAPGRGATFMIELPAARKPIHA